eukprot:4175031-Pyramimonas_sp.AAC.1
MYVENLDEEEEEDEEGGERRQRQRMSPAEAEIARMSQAKLQHASAIALTSQFLLTCLLYTSDAADDTPCVDL